MATATQPSGWADPDGWFSELGVAPDSDDATVRKALRAALRRAHPDKGDTAAGADAVQHWQDVTRVLQTQSLRWTYHTRGAKAALNGVHTYDGSERLDVTTTLNVSIGQLLLGGSAQVLCMRRVHRRGQQRRTVHVEWDACTPDGVLVKIPGKGHVEDVRHPITGETRTANGDVYVKLQAQPQQTPHGNLLAINGDLVYSPTTVSAASILSRSPIAVPIAFHTSTSAVDAAQGVELQVTPADGRCFARVNRVAGMGITPANALYIVLPHTLECLQDIRVPPGVGELLADANSCARPVQGLVDHAFTLSMTVTNAMPALHAESMTMAAFQEAQQASLDSVTQLNKNVAQTPWNVSLDTSDAAETAMLHQLNAGRDADTQLVQAGDAHSVTGCAQQ